MTDFVSPQNAKSKAGALLFALGSCGRRYRRHYRLEDFRAEPRSTAIFSLDLGPEPPGFHWLRPYRLNERTILERRRYVTGA